MDYNDSMTNAQRLKQLANRLAGASCTSQLLDSAIGLDCSTVCLFLDSTFIGVVLKGNPEKIT